MYSFVNSKNLVKYDILKNLRCFTLHIEPISLILVNIVIYIYLWKVLPILFPIGIFNEAFAFCAPIIFILAGAFYAFIAKRILKWQLIITVLINLWYIILYRNTNILDLGLYLLFYYLMLNYGGYLLLKNIETRNRRKRKIIHIQLNFKYKILKYIEVLLVVFVVDNYCTDLLCMFDLGAISIVYCTFIGLVLGVIVYRMFDNISITAISFYALFSVIQKYEYIFDKPIFLLSGFGIIVIVMLAGAILAKYSDISKYSLKEFSNS